jgi:hypothetical protein
MTELKHHGVIGMHWGTRRSGNRSGGSDGKPDASKKRGKIGKHLDSMKRERDWHKVLSELHNMSTKDITTVKKRIDLENNLKTLSKSNVATKKDKEDYLRRHNMSDQELTRKITRLRAKDSLHKAVKEASKEQRDFGQKVINIASSVGMRYVKNRMAGKKLSQNDIFESLFVSNNTKSNALNKISDKALGRTKLSEDNKKKAKDILNKAYESKSKKPKS